MRRCASKYSPTAANLSSYTISNRKPDTRLPFRAHSTALYCIVHFLKTRLVVAEVFFMISRFQEIKINEIFVTCECFSIFWLPTKVAKIDTPEMQRSRYLTQFQVMFARKNFVLMNQKWIAKSPATNRQTSASFKCSPLRRIGRDHL